MTHIGVLIDADENGIKAASYGVVTAARSGVGNAVTAFLHHGDAAERAPALARYGVSRVVS